MDELLRLEFIVFQGGWRGQAGFDRLAVMNLATVFFFSRFYPTPWAVGRR
ncbi:MAG: hypothetical protein WCB97_13855 [Thiobacillus sp.]|jgi:hypothetical protein